MLRVTSSHACAIRALGRRSRTRKTPFYGVVRPLLLSPLVHRLWQSTIVTGVAALFVVGCASTRVGSIGRLSNDEPLLTLVVTEDRKRVDAECKGVPSLGALVGCHVARRVERNGHPTVKAVKIVRLTDRLPSAMAFEIEAHELCHALASVQSMADPCHAEDRGVWTSAPIPALGLSLR